MTIKTLSTVAVIAAILIAVTVFVSQRKDATSPPTGQPVFPVLKAAINDVSEMSISTQSGTLTVHREDDSWRVKEKHEYPADLGKVRESLIGLAELKILEPKTRKPELYEKLGVQDVDAEGSLSTGVTLKDAAGNTLAEVIIGNDRPAKGNSDQKEMFIRKPGNPQTWLAMGKLSIEKNPGEWLDKELIRIETKRVRRMRVTHPDDTRLVLEKAKPADLDYHMVDLPEGLELQSQFTVNNVVSTVASLSLDDVNPRTGIPFDQQPVVTAVFETFDGFEGTVTLLRKDEKDYVQDLGGIQCRSDLETRTRRRTSPPSRRANRTKSARQRSPRQTRATCKIKPEAGSQSRNRSPEQAGRGMGLCHPQIPRRGHPQKTPRPPQNIRQIRPAPAPKPSENLSPSVILDACPRPDRGSSQGRIHPSVSFSFFAFVPAPSHGATSWRLRARLRRSPEI